MKVSGELDASQKEKREEENFSQVFSRLTVRYITYSILTKDVYSAQEAE